MTQEGQALADKLTALKRAQFLQDEQKAEAEIEQLMEEFHEKIVAILLRHAEGEEGKIPRHSRRKVQEELRNTAIWLAAELETILRDSMERAAKQGIEAERLAQRAYLMKVLPQLPEEQRKRIIEQLGRMQRANQQKSEGKEG